MRWILAIFFMIVTPLVGYAALAQTGPVQVLQNQWALGIDNAVSEGDIDSAWDHTQTLNPANSQPLVTLSVPQKNPAPPDGNTQGGASFKNGPVQFQGNGLPNTPAISSQVIDFQQQGVTQATSYDVSFDALIIHQNGTTTLDAVLYGSDGTELAQLLNYNSGASVDCGLLAWDNRWGKYCGGTFNVPHYNQYTLIITTKWNTGLGIKWTGLNLFVEPAGPAPTPTPTPVPTTTPEVFQIFRPDGVEVICVDGTLSPLPPEGNSIEVRCN